MFLVLILTMILGHWSGEIPPDLYDSNNKNQGTEKAIESFKKASGLNEPFFYFTIEANNIYSVFYPVFRSNGSNNRFHRYMKSVLDGSLGYSSYYKTSVWQVLKTPLIRTVILNGIAISLIYILGLVIGFYQVKNETSLLGRIIDSIGQILYAFPSFWLALLLLWLFSNRQIIYLFPSNGWNWNDDLPFIQALLNFLWHIILPVISLASGGIIYVATIFKQRIKDEAAKNYYKSLQARGFSETQIMRSYLYRIGLIPIVAISTGLFPAIIGGTVIIESIFGIPGMGNLAFNSFLTRDFQVIYTITLISAALTWLNWLISDYLYTKIDPRINFA